MTGKKLEQGLLWDALIKNKGDFVSGESLAEQTGASRAAVWKEIKKMRDAGCRIKAAPRKGYCLEYMPDVIVPSLINRAVSDTIFSPKIHYIPSTSSTNDILKDMARQGAPEGTALISDCQTQGKGRLGRGWYSPPGEGLWMSVLLRPPVHPLYAGNFPLLTALSVSDAFIPYCPDIGVKWPNDLIWKGRKLAGILVEIGAECEKINHMIIGIGVNLRQEVFPGGLNGAVSLKQITGREIARHDLICRILLNIHRDYGDYLKNGFAGFREKWLGRAVHMGRLISVMDGDRAVEGYFVDLTRQGELVLDVKGERVTVRSGDVALQ
ncbi:MAG: biotin--[acetyl-CoA-carboxylase] ligase [Bacillota bacterium]